MDTYNQTNDYSLLTLAMGDLVQPAPLVSRTTSIQQTAYQITQTGSHTALIVEESQLCGIVTDQNFRARVIAVGHDPQQAIDTIMTAHPITLPPNAPALEAMLLMANHNIRHIPVVDPYTRQILGVVTATDLLRNQTHHAVYLIGDIYRANEVTTLQRLSAHIPQALVDMVRQNMTAYHIAHTISSIGQAITRRLLQLAEQQYGDAPIPYAFVVAGSLARQEQTAHSDQDNGMILSDSYDEAKHGQYFLDIATFVSDGLNACGYEYCPGNIMATNSQWRQPLAVWRGYFREWIEVPEPQALLYATIFFDLRCIYGDESLFTSLQSDILHKTQHHALFQTLLAANALTFSPPLGFFKTFQAEKRADGRKALNMKKRGVVPVIDLARVYALALGLPELNTRERLQAIGKVDTHLNQHRLTDLIEAFAQIGSIRLQQQAKQIAAGQRADNYVVPEQLSSLEQRYLKAAFEVVADVQAIMSQQYQADKLR